MKLRRWVIVATFIPILLFITSIFLLIKTDTYSILNPKTSSFYGEPNRNFLKVEHILSHPQQYDSFIFGSSRVGAILPSNINNGTYYNMTYSEGVPHEHLINLKLFLTHGIKIKNILLGLDEFSYQVSFTEHQQRFLTRSHPLASGENWWTFYKFYFFRFPSGQDKRYFKQKQFHHNQTIPMDIENQNTFYNMAMSGGKLHKSDTIFNKPILYHGNHLDTTLDDIQQIVQLCQKHNIKLTVFLNPIHHKTYEHTNKTLLHEFKDRLVTITPYYDFSGPNKTTLNNTNFLDTSHYTINVANSMLQSMDLLETSIQVLQ